MSGTFPYESRRIDPVVRAKVERVLTAQQKMMEHAAKVLKDLRQEMNVLANVSDENSHYEKCFKEVRMASYTVSRNAEFMAGIGGETYIGNMAAGRMGENLEGINMDVRFGGAA